MPPNEAEASKAATGDSETAPLAATEDVKVKFTSGANDAKLEMGNNEVAFKAADDEFAAMTKAELMKYAKDPFWVALRWALFVLFWVIWVAMLVSAIVIIVYAPKCPPPAPKQWWQKAPIYQVYVKSFKDTNGDGIGDLKGVESKLDYLADLGVGTVALSPVFKSPMVDNGYDITDFTAVDDSFGSLQDFKDLLAGAHERDIKLIVDFVPNHSSDQHEWFAKSVAREGAYADYYVWADGANGGPPNNWKSVFGGSAWELNAERGQYYLHQFYKQQPDLNLRNPQVKKEMKEVLKFWLDLGVDGFRVDGVAHFFESEGLEDEAVTSTGGDGYSSVEHQHTFGLADNLALLNEFRAVLDEKTAQDQLNPRVMMTEAYVAVEDMGKYYGTIDEQIGSVSQLPINFALIENLRTEQDATAEKVHEVVTSYLDALPEEVEDPDSNLVKTNATALTAAWSNFNTGNHDHPRLASRLGAKLVDAMNMVVMLLQGTPITYYGDEIGMVDGVAAERTAYRTPMQWSAGDNAGFTSGTPWTPVNADYQTVNVESQLKEGVASHLTVFRKLAAFRHHDAVLFGETEFKVINDVFGFTRVKKGNPGMMVLVNFGDAEAEINAAANFTRVPDEGNLEVIGSAFDNGSVVRAMKMTELKLQPKEGRVITFVPDFD